MNIPIYSYQEVMNEGYPQYKLSECIQEISLTEEDLKKRPKSKLENLNHRRRLMQVVMDESRGKDALRWINEIAILDDLIEREKLKNTFLK